VTSRPEQPKNRTWKTQNNWTHSRWP